jgi:hypothetical protein
VVTGTKFAVTELAAVTVTLQAAAPVQAPDQPVKVLLVPGVSLRVTRVFCAKLAEHAVGQLIPAGVLVMLPVPVPAIVTATLKLLAVVTADGLSPTQPASIRVDSAHTEVNQNLYRDFMARYSSKSPKLDETRHRGVAVVIVQMPAKSGPGEVGRH